MKAWMRHIGREWERSCLWLGVALLVVLAGAKFSGLFSEDEPAPLTSSNLRARPSHLNGETAFDFLDADSRRLEEVRNPFAFSVRVPRLEPAPQPVAASGETPETGTSAPETSDTVAATGSTEAAGMVVPPDQDAIRTDPAPAPPKRTASVLYRGLYRGGGDRARQVAFLSTSETPGQAPSAVVLGEGETVAGVTVKRFSSAEVVVAGPTGEEVSIALGHQATVALE